MCNSCQKWQNSDFQSQFSMSKNIRKFLKKRFIEEYDFRGTLFVINIFWRLHFFNNFIFYNNVQFLTTFIQANARLKNFLRGWLLVLGLKRCLVECPTMYVKSEVILTANINRYITVVIIIVWPHLYYIIDFIRNFTPLCASIFLKVVKTCFEANCKLARRDLQRKFVGNYLDLHRRSFSSLVLSHWRFKLSALASKDVRIL